MTTTATACSRLGEVILVRLLSAGKQPLGPAKLWDSLKSLFKHPPTEDEREALLQELVNAGLLNRKPLRLTEAGQAQALAVVGLESLPARAGWKALRPRLVLRALGVAPEATDTQKRLADARGLAAWLLAERYELKPDGPLTLDRVLESLACREMARQLRIPAVGTLKELQAIVLSRMLDPDERLDAERLAKVLPAHLLGARSLAVDDIRAVVVQSWLGQPPGRPSLATPSSEPREFDLQAFANTVRAAARNCPTGRFGDNKVFISHVWRQMSQEPGVPAMDLPAFKSHLVEANRGNLLKLSRADLVEVMNPADVKESETRFLNAEFHFILLEGDRP